MSPGGDEQRRRLVSRNAQLRFLNALSDQGKFVADSKFKFLDDEAHDDLLDRIAERIRASAERRVSDRSLLLDTGRNWLHRQQDVVLCYVRNVGVLCGDSRDFIEHFDLFTQQVTSNFLFSTETLSSGVQCLEEDGLFICVQW